MNEITKSTEISLAIQNAIGNWIEATTNHDSRRYKDLKRDKRKALVEPVGIDEKTGKELTPGFFAFIGKERGFEEISQKELTTISSPDIKAWTDELKDLGLSNSTIYGKVSKLSSFYDWLLKSELAEEMGILFNPARLARPKAPKAYQTESTQSLSDEEMQALVDVVKAKNDVVGKRDYALLVFYLSTGWRRAEIINLRWGDIKVNGGLLATIKVKGGDIETWMVEDPAVRNALIDYLQASGRLATMQADTPLWTRHDRAGSPGDQLTSHAFTANLKRYAKQAGIDDFHLHQLRHTFARVMGEETGSVKAVQEMLGHKNEATTRVYLKRVGVHRDLASKKMVSRFGL
jgi:integrase/recombinase XerC